NKQKSYYYIKDLKDRKLQKEAKMFLKKMKFYCKKIKMNLT
ncbi:hypothetical protein QI7_0476, partial [Clostridioides difficile 6042]